MHAGSSWVGIGTLNVHFGSKADMCVAKRKRDVRFTPNSDRESGFPHKVMSALPLPLVISGVFRIRASLIFMPLSTVSAASLATKSFQKLLSLSIASCPEPPQPTLATATFSTLCVTLSYRRPVLRISGGDSQRRKSRGSSLRSVARRAVNGRAVSIALDDLKRSNVCFRGQNRHGDCPAKCQFCVRL
jgi:hypothetical protein